MMDAWRRGLMPGYRPTVRDLVDAAQLNARDSRPVILPVAYPIV